MEEVEQTQSSPRFNQREYNRYHSQHMETNQHFESAQIRLRIKAPYEEEHKERGDEFG